MEKKFEEVFPSLQLDQALAQGLEGATVERVSANRARDAVRIYLHLFTLVPKRKIRTLEKEIKKQCFAGEDIRVHIMERFTLSALYTPETLLQAYNDSLLDELGAYSSLLLYLYKKARFSFAEKTVTLELEDTVIAHEYEQELHDILDKVLCERCGMDCVLHFSYREAEKSRHRANAQLEIEQKIAEISREKERLHYNKEPQKKAEEEQKRETAPKAAARMKKRAENPDLIYGRAFLEDAIPIKELADGIGEVVVRGKIIGVETREIRNERTIIILTLTDFTDTIVAKLFTALSDAKGLLEDLYKGAFIKIKATPKIDSFDHDLTLGSVYGIVKINDFTEARQDHAPEKRVELHCHTKMSDMDGVTDVEDIIKRAMDWGHKAIAITDHGVVQAFPGAAHAVPAGADFKVIYGCEIYLVDDTRGIVTGEKGQTLDAPFVVFDLETTGFHAENNRIIEIGAVKVENAQVTERFSSFVNPQSPIPFRITELTSIRDEDVMDAPVIEEILPRFLEFCQGCVLVAHNADFDMGFLRANCKRLGLVCEYTYVDTVGLSRFLLPSLAKYKLDHVAKAVGVELGYHHRAVDDAECTAHIFEKFIGMLRDRGMEDLAQINREGRAEDEAVRKMPANHCIVLAKNDIGRINLYRLISLSHLQYFHRRPKIPKSLLQRYREGLIVGSACEAGELYRALWNDRSEEEIARIVGFYDYLEIQPLGNNLFLLETEDGEGKTQEDLRDINRRIVALGEEYRKPVVATCDVHFLDPGDEIYRRIIMAATGFSDADHQAPLYLHTTEEMLEEFSYLGSGKAEEVVITNTNRIADMCEPISPVRPDKCPPVIEDSDVLLRRICYDRAHAVYGDPLPPVVEERLSRELNSIIGNGYAVMYIIAQKLVWKSNEDGYLVGSRGSVGSSFAATMAGITEVNPLSPHYLCEYCHYVDLIPRRCCNIPAARAAICRIGNVRSAARISRKTGSTSRLRRSSVSKATRSRIST